LLLLSFLFFAIGSYLHKLVYPAGETLPE